MEIKHFSTVEELITYSTIRTNIRVYSKRYHNARIHKLTKGTIKNFILHGNYSITEKTLEKELEFRQIIKLMNLPISVKVK